MVKTMVLSCCSVENPSIAVNEPHSGTARLPFDLPLEGVYRPIIARAAQSHLWRFECPKREAMENRNF